MDASQSIQTFAHLHWGHYPTPIETMPRLQAALGTNAPTLFIKRDDYTGPGFGGNKVRKLEYFLAQAVADQCEVVITIGGVRSNHCRVTAAFCAKLGLRCILILNATELPAFKPASVFAEELYGAEIHLVRSREERTSTMRRLAGELRQQGLKVCEVPLGASTALGALGYVAAANELKTQIATEGLRFDYIFHSSSSGGTQAGLVAGCYLSEISDVQIIGVSPDDSSESIGREVGNILAGVADLLQVAPFRSTIRLLDEYVGEGYGIDTPESVVAIQLLAQTEGIVLDPTYTAKAMAALLDWIRLGKITASDNVLFWHTGGQLAHFNSHQGFSP